MATRSERSQNSQGSERLSQLREALGNFWENTESQRNALGKFSRSSLRTIGRHIDPILFSLGVTQLDKTAGLAESGWTQGTTLLAGLGGEWLGERLGRRRPDEIRTRLNKLFLELQYQATAVASAKMAVEYFFNGHNYDWKAITALALTGGDEVIGWAAGLKLRQDRINGYIFRTGTALLNLGWGFYVNEAMKATNNYGLGGAILLATFLNLESATRSVPDVDIVFSSLLRNTLWEKERHASGRARAIKANLDSVSRAATAAAVFPVKDGERRRVRESDVEKKTAKIGDALAEAEREHEFWNSVRGEIFGDSREGRAVDPSRYASYLSMGEVLSQLTQSGTIGQDFEKDAKFIWHTRRLEARILCFYKYLLQGRVFTTDSEYRTFLKESGFSPESGNRISSHRSPSPEPKRQPPRPRRLRELQIRDEVPEVPDPEDKSEENKLFTDLIMAWTANHDEDAKKAFGAKFGTAVNRDMATNKGRQYNLIDLATKEGSKIAELLAFEIFANLSTDKFKDLYETATNEELSSENEEKFTSARIQFKKNACTPSQFMSDILLAILISPETADYSPSDDSDDEESGQE